MHRRQLLRGFFGAPLVGASGLHDRDAELVHLGHEYLELARELERLELTSETASNRGNIFVRAG
jgi:hypothetical protein